MAESLSIDDQHYDVRWQQIARKQQAQQPSGGQTLIRLLVRDSVTF